MDEIDYERDISIDESALDVEWLEQAQLGLKYGRFIARLHKKVTLADEKKKTVRSELIMEANKFPVKCCGKDKPNAADIEAYYRNHPDYKEAVQNLIDAQYEAEYGEVAKNEICWTRKAALENLVKLHGQMYFAGPKVPRDLSKEFETRKKQELSNEKVTMKRKEKSE